MYTIKVALTVYDSKRFRYYKVWIGLNTMIDTCIVHLHAPFLIMLMDTSISICFFLSKRPFRTLCLWPDFTWSKFSSTNLRIKTKSYTLLTRCIFLSLQKVQVDSNTRMCDIHSKIVKKLQLKNGDEYGLFFGLKDKGNVTFELTLYRKQNFCFSCTINVTVVCLISRYIYYL